MLTLERRQCLDDLKLKFYQIVHNMLFGIVILTYVCLANRCNWNLFNHPLTMFNSSVWYGPDGGGLDQISAFTHWYQLLSKRFFSYFWC